MTIRIERESYRLKTMIRVSGRLQSEHLDELKTQLAGTQSRIALDLNDVTLVDVEIVRFLNACEKGGVEILHCWPYIQEWMSREKAGKNNAVQCWYPKLIYTQEGGIPMTTTAAQNNDHTMKHIMFIILGALTVMCLALGTGYLQP